MAAINFSRLTFVSNHSVRREYTVEVKIYKQVLWMSLAYLAYVNITWILQELQPTSNS